MKQYEWLLYVLFGLLLGMGGAWIAGKPQARDASPAITATATVPPPSPTPPSVKLLAHDDSAL